MNLIKRLIQKVVNRTTTSVSDNSLDGAIKEGTNEGIRLAFENTVFEKCDGKDHPDERCPQKSGKCVCAYVQWRELSKWKQIFVEQPPRPSKEDCFNVMITPLILEEIAKRKRIKSNGQIH
jgi:hypothetical protein